METEMKPQVKEEWKTPELIVLVRNKPEEAVLSGCKTSAIKGANSSIVVCFTGVCVACSGTTGSS